MRRVYLLGRLLIWWYLAKKADSFIGLTISEKLARRVITKKLATGVLLRNIPTRLLESAGL